MYNINSHYENIYNLAKHLSPDPASPVLLYFNPYGSINYENLEVIHSNGNGKGPILICFDQEPITDHLFTVLKLIQKSWGTTRNYILLNTEQSSTIKINLLNNCGMFLYDCPYFFHIFAAADWYRGYNYNKNLISTKQREINKKFITFNRITGNSRGYRSIFVSELIKYNLLQYGHVSYSTICPEHGHYKDTIFDLVAKHNVSENICNEAISFLTQIKNPLRIDQKDSTYIPNGSQTIDAVPEIMESFLYVVTETCFWENKTHLTEKIFKPIVTKNPFVLLGCYNNLKYLQSYGFKTFDAWWDESYDNIEDPLSRLYAVVKIINYICQLSNKELKNLLLEMNNVLEYNYRLFYSKKFIDMAWKELAFNLEKSYLLSKQINFIDSDS